MADETGSAADLLARLKSTLPARWCADATPVLDGLLSGLAAAWATIYAQLQQARLQARVSTATGGFLDLIATDFFGTRLRRRPGQGDAAYRDAIGRELRRERATRAGLAAVLTDLVGQPPVIFELTRPADTGAWGLCCGYGAAGGWGSLSLPFQCLVTVRRPVSGGIALTPPWSGPQAAWGQASCWASMAMLQGQTVDSDIYAAAAGAMPAASIAWVRITS